MKSEKYGRTYHYPFSPGTTSDDRIQHEYWDCIGKMKAIVHTEKLDGENNCLNRYGVFARSHAARTTSPWTSNLRRRWEMIKHDLGDLELFGENLYAIHSIGYHKLHEHYHVFAIRCLDRWLCWEEVKFYAAAFDLPVVPELKLVNTRSTEPEFRNGVLALTATESMYGSYDITTGKACMLEGIVSRNIDEFAVANLGINVFKYVRRGHVKTDKHWSRNWTRARLLQEKNDELWD